MGHPMVVEVAQRSGCARARQQSRPCQHKYVLFAQLSSPATSPIELARKISPAKDADANFSATERGNFAIQKDGLPTVFSRGLAG